MGKSEKRIQSKSIAFRVTNEIYERIKIESAEKNSTVGAYVKTIILGATEAKKYKTIRVPRSDEELLRQILGQIGKLGSNVNQIAKVANRCGFEADEYDNVYDNLNDLYKIRELLLVALSIVEKNDF